MLSPSVFLFEDHLENVSIGWSGENVLREKVLENGNYLRQILTKKGYQVLGRVSPFVCVRIGNEAEVRMIAKLLMDNSKNILM